ncbi:MAG: hypothetical protein WDN31_12810 [Hyphomicrobium sp.]
MQDPDQQRNLLIAVVLSMAVLLGWQFFYAGPKMKQEQARLRAQQELVQKEQDAAKPASPAASAPGSPLPAAKGGSEDAIKTSPRLAIETPSSRAR